MREFDPKTLSYLSDKFYVYALRDSGNGQTFYIGKGKRNRVFSHEIIADSVLETEKQKIKRIHEIEARGDQVEHILILRNLSESDAFAAEAALINMIQYTLPDALTNIQGGHHAEPAMDAEMFNNLYGADELRPEDIHERVIIIKINRTYTPGQTPDEIKEYVRGHWRLNIKRAKAAKYIFAVFKGWIVGVYEIEKWYSSTELTSFFPNPKDYGNPKLTKRYYCTCNTIALDNEIGKQYLYKLVNSFSKSTQNPISYIDPAPEKSGAQNEQLLLRQINCLRTYIPFLENICSDAGKRQWCLNYSVYSTHENKNMGLQRDINNFISEMYNCDFIPSNYDAIYSTIQDETLYQRIPIKSKMNSLTNEQVIACIAKQFREDHFNEGVLISEYIADGVLLEYMKALLTRISLADQA